MILFKPHNSQIRGGGRGLLSPQWLENRKFHRQRTNWRKPKNVLLGTGFAMWHRPAMITTSVLINLNEIYHAKAKWQVWSTRCLSLQDQAQVIKVSWPWKGQKKTLESFEQLLVTSHFFFFFLKVSFCSQGWPGSHGDLSLLDSKYQESRHEHPQ